MIEFKLHPDPKMRHLPCDLAERLADLFEGDPSHTWQADPETEPGRWEIGAGNNWWLTVDGDEVKISARYAPPEVLSALRTVLIYVLGVERFNQEAR